MKDVSLFSKLGRRFTDPKEKSLSAHLLELTRSVVEQDPFKTARLIAEITQSDAVLLCLHQQEFFSHTLSSQEQDFLRSKSVPKPGQHAKLNSLIQSHILSLGRSEIHAFSEHDRALLTKISNHIQEDFIKHERYIEIVRDSITGFWGREAFFDILEQEFARSRRYHAPLSLILIDIDAFSRFSNPQLVLSKTAQRIQSEIRQGDFIARLTENTFVLLEPMTQPKNAGDSASRLLSKFKHLPILIQETPLHVHLSMGGASLHGQDGSPVSLLERADRALLAAKRLGGNQIVMFDSK